jgi:hypothetical protein
MGPLLQGEGIAVRWPRDMAKWTGATTHGLTETSTAAQ